MSSKLGQVGCASHRDSHAVCGQFGRSEPDRDVRRRQCGLPDDKLVPVVPGGVRDRPPLALTGQVFASVHQAGAAKLDVVL